MNSVLRAGKSPGLTGVAPPTVRSLVNVSIGRTQLK